MVIYEGPQKPSEILRQRISRTVPSQPSQHIYWTDGSLQAANQIGGGGARSKVYPNLFIPMQILADLPI